MEHLEIESLEWLLMTTMKEKDECEEVLDQLRSLYIRSLVDLQKSPSYQERMKQLDMVNVCILAISERILKLKKAVA